MLTSRRVRSRQLMNCGSVAMPLTASQNGNYKKIKVFYTGGTIGMQKNEDGAYAPKPHALTDKIRETPELHNKEAAEKIQGTSSNSHQFVLKHTNKDCIFLYDIEEYHPLLDSSNMAPDSWIRLAKDIKRDYGSYDGFVIFHGTDTIAYTASALSFMLEGLTKSVILTGAMIPIFDVRSDAINNIACSLILAGCYNIPEVTVFCANKLLRGNRTSKLSAESMKPFDTPNYPPLAIMDCSEEVNYANMLKAETQPDAFSVQEDLCGDVVVFPVYPGIKVSTLNRLLQHPVKGVVLQCFGAGNVPCSPEILQALSDAFKQKILIVRVTLCQKGFVNDVYEVGLALSKAGVVSGSDMTTEAAYGKLCWVLAKNKLSFEEKCNMMKKNVRGELTDSNS